MKPKTHQPESSQQGVVIIEALIAILIFSFGVLGIVGMQANMVKNTSDSKFRSDAGYIAQQQIGLMWVNPATQPADGATASSVAGTLPNGVIFVTRAGSQFALAVTWQQPGEDLHTFRTTASILP
jgi:type IV pilus assembly protein PilV